MESTTECLIEKKVTSTQLSGFVQTKLKSSRMECPDNVLAKLRTCKEVRDVMNELLHEDCDVIVFYDVVILESIIHKYCGENEVITEELKQYNMELDDYLSMRICEHHLFQQYVDVVGTRVKSVAQSELLLFMDDSWTKHMHLKKFYRLQKRISKFLRCGIQLKLIKEGSLCFCYHIFVQDFMPTELNIMQILSLINFGVTALISGCEYVKEMEPECKCVQVYDSFALVLAIYMLLSSVISFIL